MYVKKETSGDFEEQDGKEEGGQCGRGQVWTGKVGELMGRGW